jgi:ABC-type transport system involved in cytochrome bd biosynthesis fused ATPase/permease subunit
LPVGFTFMLVIIVFMEAANALSAGVIAGFIVMLMPFMSSARTLPPDSKRATKATTSRDRLIALFS